MGGVISRIWRKPSTEEVLQRLEDESAALQQLQLSARRRQQRMRTLLVGYSLLLCVAAMGVGYWRGPPADSTGWLMLAGLLLLCPTLIYVLKGALTWHYDRRISQSTSRLRDIGKQKERLLDEVQDKEPYRVARKILEKFAPEQLRRTPPRAEPVSQAVNASDEGSVRHRQLVAATPRAPMTSTPRLMPAPGAAPTPIVPGSGRFSGRSPLVQTPAAMRGRGVSSPGTMSLGRAGPPLPRPVLPRERGYMDRVMDYLVGDGPANRYALICCQCQGHNGMALEEEFQYLAFRCCYCFAWNPARKQRPTAPRLPAAPTSDSMHESDTTESSDSEPVVPPPPVAGSEGGAPGSSSAAEDPAGAPIPSVQVEDAPVIAREGAYVAPQSDGASADNEATVADGDESERPSEGMDRKREVVVVPAPTATATQIAGMDGSFVLVADETLASDAVLLPQHPVTPAVPEVTPSDASPDHQRPASERPALDVTAGETSSHSVKDEDSALEHRQSAGAEEGIPFIDRDEGAS